MKRTKQTKRIQRSFLVFILLFAFLLCSCNQGISQSPEQTEAQIQKEELPITEESKTEEEKLFEEYIPLRLILSTHTLEERLYQGLLSGVCRLKDEILEGEKILPEHLKEAERQLRNLERLQNDMKKTDFSRIDTLFPGEPNTFLCLEKARVEKIQFFQKLLQEILNKNYEQFLKDNELLEAYLQKEIPELEYPEMKPLSSRIVDLAEYDKEAARYFRPQYESLCDRERELERKLQKTERGKELLKKYREDYPWKGEDTFIDFETIVNKNDYKEKD
ncbi:hypothetical protein HMPREF1987_01467 [Peptostreptococcaceae bacterium oral taxon 113 str. W5053]|nr:hypothetical protein HMPREF1987_01467 [Peptostreptococcaceae bacterium oral taxon 113 str. W5053]